MRNTKKAISILLTLLMVVGMMSTFAFAKDVDSGKGGRASITIENASKGETYTVYKILNAKVSSKNDTNGKSESVTYQLLDGHTNIPSIFKKDANNLVWNGTTAPNVLSETDVAVLEKYVDDEKLDAEAIAESDGSTLIFKNLTYGYYLIKSSQGSAVTVTSTTPNATIHDKNGNTPGGDKYKKIVDDTDVYIGQTVNYTLTYPTSNYIGSGANAKQVVKYTVSDTLPDYLDSVTLTSVKIYNKDYGVEGATPVEEADLTSSVTFNTTSKSFDIVWAENGTSKYTNGAVIEVKYSAVINNKIAIAGNGSKNEFNVTYTLSDNTTGGSEIKKEATVKTYAIAIKKVNSKGEGLAGAKFNVPFNVTGSAGNYTVTGLNDTTGTDVEVGTDGVLIIRGINSDTSYTMTETQAPDGYNKLQGSVSITPVANSETTTNTTIYLDANGNQTNEVTETVVNYVNNDLAATVIPVLNTTGTQLPETGGIGTTIFYLIGAILVIGAGVVFVTRRRMHSDK